MLPYYLNEFVIFSFLGWVYESIFCTIRKHHWQNRGFLFGPVCPIYGSCVVLGDLFFRMLSQKTGMDPAATPVWQVFLAAALGSAVIEFTTSYVLEKRFHAIWWDYSRLPLNLQGRISLFTSLGFGAAGVLIFRFILPVSERILMSVPQVLSMLASYLFVAVLAGDFALTEASLSDLLSQIQMKQAEVNERMETGYARLEEQGERLTEAARKLNRGIRELVPPTSSQEWQRGRVLHVFQRNVLENIRHFRTKEQDSIAAGILKRLREKREELRNRRSGKEEKSTKRTEG